MRQTMSFLCRDGGEIAWASNEPPLLSKNETSSLISKSSEETLIHRIYIRVEFKNEKVTIIAVAELIGLWDLLKAVAHVLGKLFERG